MDDDPTPAHARLTDAQAQELVLATVAKHAESLLRVAYKYSLCADDAHDAYQRGMEILLRRAPTLDPRTTHKWLHIVVKHEAMEVRRARLDVGGADEVDYELVEAHDTSTPEDRALTIDRATRAAEALRRLKPQELRTVWLKALGHSYQDAAGNETVVRRAEPLLVDNHAPAAPVGLAVAQPVSESNSFSATWSLPVDHGAPIDRAEYQLCQDGACGAPQVAPRRDGVGGLALAHAGAATLRVWLRDARGHEDPAGGAATIQLTYAPPPPVSGTPPICACTPTVPSISPVGTTPPATTPTTAHPPVKLRKASPALKLTTLRRVGRKLTVGGTVSAKASGAVTVRYRVVSHGRAHSVAKRVAIRRRSFRTTVMLSGSLAAARSATVSVSYPGDTDTIAQRRTAVLHARA